MVKSSYKRTIIILIGDILIVVFSYVAGYWIRFGSVSGFKGKFPFWFLFTITLCYLGIFYFFNLYILKKNYIMVNYFVNILLSIAIASVVVSFLNYAIFLFPIGRGILVLSNLILLLSVLVWRGFCSQLFKYLVKPKRLIIAGTGKAGQEIARIIEFAGDDFEIVGFVDDIQNKTDKSPPKEKIKILGSSDQILALSEKHIIDQVVFASGERENPSLTKKILDARLKGIEVVNMPDMYQNLKKRIPIDYVQENWFLKEKGFERSNNIFILKVKRSLDIILSSLILLMSLPLWPVIALLIKINSRGPVFYTQQRVGKNESLFNLYKFRSMIDKAEENDPVWADENDIRITLIGKILRTLHLDELPQFWNVIRGEMSLVGSRPERPKFVEELKQNIPYYSLRHFMKPGITGWAQLNYPYASSLKDSHEKLEYDLYYISHMSLLFDVQILIKTAQIIMLGKQRMRLKNRDD